MIDRLHRGHYLFIHICLILMILGGIFPIVWLFLTSLKLDGELTRLPITYLPDQPTLKNYVRVFENNPFARFLLNSMVVAGFATLFCILFSALAGYALARLHIPGRKVILLAIVITSMFPALVLLVPLYRLFVGVDLTFLNPFLNYFERLGWGHWPDNIQTPNLLNTYAALIIPYIALSIPISTLTLTSFFQLIPEDLESAAMIDGCSRIGTLFRIIAPLSAPGMVTAGIICFVNSWNEFLLAFTFNTTLKMRTVPVGIVLYQGEFSFDWSIISAALVLGIVPLVILIIFFQQRIVSGLTAGGVKG